MLEIEIKSLLGSSQKAQDLKKKMETLDPNFKLTDTSKQLNHYFKNISKSALEKIANEISIHLSDDKKIELKKIIEHGKNPSVRTRQLNNDVLFIIKASIDETTSSNGISRIEFEEKINLTLDELDQILLDAGLLYEAKWSREREQYEVKNATVTIDKNAGYGYVAEFEKVVNNDSDPKKITQELRDLMKELDVVELDQERLGRMFDFYNKNWEKYYGTDNIFIIE